MMKQIDNTQRDHEERTDIHISLRMQNLQYIMLTGTFVAFTWTN